MRTVHFGNERDALRLAGLWFVEPLERRLLCSASIANNPILQFARAGSNVNTTDDGALNINYQPPDYTLENLHGFLSPSENGDKLAIARAFLAAHAEELHVTPDDLAGAIVTDQYTDADTGITHIYMRQTAHGVPIINANLGIHLMPDGSVISANSSFITSPAKQITGADLPAISATQAVTRAAARLGIKIRRSMRATHAGAQWSVDSPDASLDPIPATKQYMATSEGIVPVWKMVMRLPGGSNDWYDLAVRTVDGTMRFATDWTDHASYNVYPLPTEAPNDGSRAIVTDPNDVGDSPFGWHDTDGVPGAEFTDTRGNNVFAQEDVDHNNTGGFRPDGSASLNFDFPIDLTQAPGTYQSAAITNLFYWNNLLHDIHYHYGFTEAAGNFQQNNYGNGGIGNDAVQADAQDGASTNNANFSTPPDGTPGRMQMFLWNGVTPNRDGDLDATVMVHEYGHGVSTRLTGGPSVSGTLSSNQSGGMGEGWSDFFALMFLQKPSDNFATDGFSVGTYVFGQPTSGVGIRRVPYSYNMSIDPLTIDAYGGSGTSGTIARSIEVHNTGEIWCSALWDMAVLLMNKYGYDSNLYTGYTTAAGPGHAGNKLALRLVEDALKLQPVNPTFAQARDAIVQADRALTGGQNYNEIWQAFARRGMGFSLNDGGNSSAVVVTPAFNLPPVDPAVMNQTPPANRTKVTPVSSMTFTFDKAIDPASFSLSDDVTFTGPGGTNLNASLTSFSFNADHTVLTINFTSTVAFGTYTMTLGPNILAADDGHAMDQNLNGTPGEAGDKYVGTFIYSNLIADNGFGYKAGQWPFENINLQPGGPNVFSGLTNNDDSFVQWLIGFGNTFRFYNTSYSNSSSFPIYVTDNGFLSFGQASSAFLNTDLDSPNAARFAPLWDDWYTALNGDDQVLGRTDDLDGDGIADRFIMEWNDVNASNAGNGVTFQAILQLNTGTTPGVMIANYVDVQSGLPSASNGASATVGIKDTGVPPPNKLVASQDDPMFPWIGDGKAIRFATDWTPPTATATFVYLTQQAVKVTFSENVSKSLTKSDFVLTNQTTNTTISPSDMALSYDTGTNIATLTFSGYPNGVLPDGIYSLSIGSTNVTDAQWNPLAQNLSSSFTVLGGDANRDGIVNALDFSALASAFGQNGDFSKGDFNYDTIVNTSDFTVLAANFNKNLSGSPATSEVATVAATPRITAASPTTAIPTGSLFADRIIGEKEEQRLSQAILN